MQCLSGRSTEVAHQHRCPPHVGKWASAGPRDSFGDHALVGALAHLADDHSVQVLLLVSGRAIRSDQISGTVHLIIDTNGYLQ